MGNSWKQVITALVCVLGTMLISCGGGGSAGETLPAKILNWDPPTTYIDGSALNTSVDLESFEIFLREDDNFSQSDQPEAAVAASNPQNGQITTSFNLANLSYFIKKGVVYHVSIRTVAKNGMKSNFSPSATFSY